MFKRKGCAEGVHKFEPRYDEKPVSRKELEVEGHMTSRALRSLMYYDVYVHDICVRCGKIVERRKSDPTAKVSA